MTTTILARDLKPGDVIDFGGQVFTVAEVVFEERFGTWRGLRLIGPDLGPYGYHIDSTMRIEVIR